MPLKSFASALFGLVVLAESLSAHAAGTFTVTPVRVDLRAGQQSASIEVANTGTVRAQFAIERFAWLGGPDGERLEPTLDFVVSPPLFDLNPGGRQVVRVLMLRPADPLRQLTYRIVLQETPPKTATEGVATVLRVSLPVFVTPAQAAAALQWRRVDLADGRFLEVVNRGTATEQLASVRLDNGVDVEGGGGYVLPGQTRRWRVPDLGAAVTVRLFNGSTQVVQITPAQ